MARKLPNQIGQSYGRLTVIAEAAKTSWGKRQWRCQCSCGAFLIVPQAALRSGNTQSCGCLQREAASNEALRRAKHGHAQRNEETPEYNAWLNMKRRCYDSSNKRWARYGGRGIRVCAEWCDDFSAFLRAVGPRPSKRHSLDRVDNDRHYEPGNVRWVKPTTQARNRSNTRALTYLGRTQTLIEWSVETGIDRTTIAARIDRLGWGVERALSTPTRACS